jgi:large subunit ribosomal protein L15
MRLHDLKPRPGAKHRRKRLGQGESSGHGKTSGRGGKGQTARSGSSIRIGFEGGQMPLIRRIPKRGFNNAWAKEVFAINLGAINDAYESGQEVTIDSLREKHLARGRFDVLKVLGNGNLTKKLKISAHRFSESAKAKIEQAGGQAIVLPGKKPVVKGQRKNGAAATE